MSHSILFYCIIPYLISYNIRLSFCQSTGKHHVQSKTLLGLPTCVAVWDVAHHHLMAALPTSAVFPDSPRCAVNIFTKELQLQLHRYDMLYIIDM